MPRYLPATLLACACAALALSSCSSGAPKDTDPFLSGPPSVTTSGPVQVLFEGDSLALTLGFGLQSGQVAYNLHVLDDGELGCGVVSGDPIMFQGEPDTYTGGASFINDYPPDCNVWSQLWTENVASAKPDVVAILVGRWETVTRMHDGQWMNVGMPAYDAYITSELETAVRICAAHGARVLLLTMPYLAPSPYPESSASRTDAFNSLLESVASRYPQWVSVYDLNKVLDPDGAYTSTVNGVTTRILYDTSGNPDGSHISIAGAELVAPTLDPLLEKLGSEARAAAG